MVIQDMPSMSPRVPLPNGDQQAEFERQLDILINEHMSYTSIITWVSDATASQKTSAID